MIGGLSSTIDLKYGVRQVGRLSQAALITGSPDCVDRRVFHEKKGLGSVSGLDFPDVFVLYFQAVLIRDIRS